MRTGPNIRRARAQDAPAIARIRIDAWRVTYRGLDVTFEAGADTTVFALAVSPDGKLSAGGGFVTLGGQSRSRVGRFNSDASVDSTFNPGVDGPVLTIAAQPGGYLLIGGLFTRVRGVRRGSLARLAPDGTPDPSFDPNPGDAVTALAVQADG